MRHVNDVEVGEISTTRVSESAYFVSDDNG